MPERLCFASKGSFLEKQPNFIFKFCQVVSFYALQVFSEKIY